MGRILLSILVLAWLPAHAEGDAALGRKLVAEKRCEDCHHNRTLGDAKAVYLRKDRRVTTLAKLKAQVSACNSELNLQLFPDEEESIVRYLDEEYYKFGGASPGAGTKR